MVSNIFKRILIIPFTLCFGTISAHEVDGPTTQLLQGHLDSQILIKFMPKIMQEVSKEFSQQNDGRTHRNTREYGYSFFKMENNDFSYTPPPQFLQELGAEICKALGQKPVEFTNIILSCYGTGFHLEPHVDVNAKDLYKNCHFYFEENVYGIVIEADPTGHLYFVNWNNGLMPPLDLPPVCELKEKEGTIFCLQNEWRRSPYFHAVSKVSNRRISITFRRVVKIQ